MPTSTKRVRSSGSKKKTSKDVKQVSRYKVGKNTDYANNTFYRDKYGKLHRDDGPAVIYWDGEKRWYQHGKRHREDGPAVVATNGTEIWYSNDIIHREDGPALENGDGTVAWYKLGLVFEPNAHDIAVWKMSQKNQTKGS